MTLGPWTPDDSDRLARLARLTPRPTMLRALLDAKGRTVATVAVTHDRPAGPWDTNRRTDAENQ